MALRSKHDPSPPYGVRPPAFRLPDAAHMGGVRLLVSNLERSIDYYERVLGLRVSEHNGTGATLAPDGAGRPLIGLHTAPGVSPARRHALGLYHFAILLPDRGTLGRFAAHLSTLSVHAGMADHLVSEALYLRDPDGLGIEVYADRARQTWQQRDGELAMRTDPLDLADLISAAGSDPWRGMPRGTTMGHVHLHVGGLDEADRFYHRALGFDKTVWSYPGALFLSAGGYHHHLGVNTWVRGPAPPPDQAQLLEWDLLVPAASNAAAAGESLRAAGHRVEESPDGVRAADPWGTHLRIRVA